MILWLNRRVWLVAGPLSDPQFIRVVWTTLSNTKLCVVTSCTEWLYVCADTVGFSPIRVTYLLLSITGRASPQIRTVLAENSLRQIVHTHRASVHQAAKLVADILRVAGATAGLAESNGSLPRGLWLTAPAGWLPRTGISSETLRSVIEYGLSLPFCIADNNYFVHFFSDHVNSSGSSKYIVSTWQVSQLLFIHFIISQTDVVHYQISRDGFTLTYRLQ